jgi:hypothetical protein
MVTTHFFGNTELMLSWLTSASSWGWILRRTVNLVEERMQFDQAFSNNNWHVNCETVGDVIDELNRLPRDLPIVQGFADSVDLVVFNRDQENAHLSFEDGGDWSDDSEDDAAYGGV